MMRKVIRYQCEYCKKDFKTPDRHNCQFDPKFKNCLSCKHLKGWQEGQFWECRSEPNHPDCAKNKDGCDIKADYNMQCPEWEVKE